MKNLLGNSKEMKKTLAGDGCSPHTFGHLGFTGTSIWVDCEKSLGVITLTNATKKFWFERDGLNNIRRSIGSFVWKNYHQLPNEHELIKLNEHVWMKHHVNKIWYLKSRTNFHWFWIF